MLGKQVLLAATAAIALVQGADAQAAPAAMPPSAAMSDRIVFVRLDYSGHPHARAKEARRLRAQRKMRSHR